MFNKKYTCVIVAIIAMFIIIRKQKKKELFRGFFKANPQLSRNMSYDTRGGINVNQKSPGKFGGIAGKESQISGTGAFYGETIIRN